MLDQIVRLKVSKKQKEHYYELAKKEYDGNFSGMVKDLLHKYEKDLQKRGLVKDE